MEIHDHEMLCGCKLKIEVSYDKIYECTEVRRVVIIYVCKQHRELDYDRL